MIKEIKGNLITLAQEGVFDIIGHGCNCFTTMGAGIAYQIKRAFPEAFTADIVYLLAPEMRLGNYSYCGIDVNKQKPLLILNIYSQYFPGKDFSLEALTIALRKINARYPNKHIGLPLIGCGIGGGNWEEVKKVIEKELHNMEVTIVLL